MLSILITIIAVALSNASDANGGNGVPVAIGGNETGVLHVAQRDEDGNRLTLDLILTRPANHENEPVDELVWSHSVPDDGTGINALEPLAARIYPERGLLLAAANASGLCSYWFPVRDGQWQPPKSLRLLPFPFGPGNRLPLRNVRIVMYDLPGEKTDMERGMIAVEVPLFDPVSPATYWFNFCFDQEADAPFFAQLGRGVSIE